MARLKTVFFGSGPVALRSLQLLADYTDIEAIVTKPSTADLMSHTLPDAPVFAVARRAELDELCLNHRFSSKFGVLIDFGVIVGQAALDSFSLGIINSHFSLLPELRGVDPITFAILSGQARTGVSLMRVVRAWDEGPLLAQAAHKISANATTPSLTSELVELSNKMLQQTLPRYVAGAIVAMPQESASLLGKDAQPTYTRKLTKEDGRIDWQKPAIVLEREIRAYLGWPSSYTKLAGKEVIITQAQIAEKTGTIGQVIVEGKKLYVCCGNKSLQILTLKPAGKKEMAATAFLAGYGRLL